MKSIITCLCFVLGFYSYGQYDYTATKMNPYGQAHPNAPEELKNFEALIGACDCKSTLRNQDGSWADSEDIIWEWKYIMNGMAVQDETLKPDGSHSGSIRQFIADSSKWYVHYYSSKFPTATLPTWEGSKIDDKIILYRDQKAPNGMEGKYRITFYDMNDSGYKWIGEWVNATETIVYPTWKIICNRDD
ncbi:hypothetical protein [Psychroserpens sp.]|uniref:hypothetical protein n=1 Tax=Psychroserpens sp. TaxID=2020870 RepID=UPI001B173454|nr:hypothetical protein [Psychroserpens sp.]MBO6608026.1 hypothetical protein [Psychroserpens sp.]MBO6632243.1 hypothetical protein [Psychroserpens sp.]MBO6655136.1 hypothetical protein [Psychroserpens sp.]MBO6683236.1 hypothetical protein [Psychroserpens sp.]MBO6751399.1 hypothetical protein [Psychroserpens sp.]